MRLAGIRLMELNLQKLGKIVRNYKMRRGIETPAHFRCLQFVRKEAGKVRVRVVCMQFGQSGKGED